MSDTRDDRSEDPRPIPDTPAGSDLPPWTSPQSGAPHPAPAGGPPPGGFPAPGGYPSPGGYPAPGGYPGPGGYPSPGGYRAPNAQWQAAPKPGLIPLRPLSFGTFMSAPFQVLSRNPRASLGSALILQGIITIVSLILMGILTAQVSSRLASGNSSDFELLLAGSVAMVLLFGVIPTIFLQMVTTMFLQGIMISEVSRGTLGEKRRLGELWRAVFPRLGHLILYMLFTVLVVLVLGGILTGITIVTVNLVGMSVGWTVLTVFIISVGFLLLIAWITVKTSLSPSVIVLERRGIVAAIGRSWRLTTGYFWKTLGIQLLIAVIVGVISQIVLTPVALLTSVVPLLLDPTEVYTESINATIISVTITTIISLLVGAVASVIQTSAGALIYIDLRMRKEGLDIDLMRYVEASPAVRADLPDPYTVVRTETPASASAHASQGPGGPAAGYSGQLYATPPRPSVPDNFGQTSPYGTPPQAPPAPGSGAPQ